MSVFLCILSLIVFLKLLLLCPKCVLVFDRFQLFQNRNSKTVSFMKIQLIQNFYPFLFVQHVFPKLFNLKLFYIKTLKMTIVRLYQKNLNQTNKNLKIST